MPILARYKLIVAAILESGVLYPTTLIATGIINFTFNPHTFGIAPIQFATIATLMAGLAPTLMIFNDGSELVPLSFPSPTPAPEPETDLTASAASSSAAPPTPVGSGPATPRPLSVLSHQSLSPTDTTNSHTTTSTVSSISTQSAANATLESLLFCLVDQQQSQQAQLNAIKDAFKANKDEGAVIAKPAVFKGDADDVARFLPMFRNWASEQKALRIKEGAGVTPEDVGKLDNRKTIPSASSFCKGGKAGRWVANYLKQANTSMTDVAVQFPFKGKWEVF
ncbi:hypothetical protein PQX77_019139 [Marasmius sp. AFHP31]|nr:hypothetical protein PQX77_019139 [Marasmius sp. AFHP31]